MRASALRSQAAGVAETPFRSNAQRTWSGVVRSTFSAVALVLVKAGPSRSRRALPEGNGYAPTAFPQRITGRTPAVVPAGHPGWLDPQSSFPPETRRAR